MKVSGSTRVLALVVVVVGAAAYILLADLGVNAGRVYRGVTVEGLDIGGQTFAEAEETLTARGKELKRAPVIFGAEGFDCRFIPGRIGWGPQPHDTAVAAMAVGRPIVSVDSFGERVDAWFDGVEVKWADDPDPAAVERLLDDCEKNARALGLQLNRPLLKVWVRRAIVTWPRPAPFRVPFID